jgi:hypothetical protein
VTDVCPQVAYARERAAYEKALADITAWQDARRIATPPSPSGAPAAGPFDASPGHDGAAAPHSLTAGGAKTRRTMRKTTASHRVETDSDETCPISLPHLSAPIPAPEAAAHLLHALAAKAEARPWVDAAARFEAAAATLALPAAALTPPPRPALATPPATPPPEPLPLNGYLWSALGKTAFVADGFEMSKAKLAELEALAAQRGASARGAAAPAQRLVPAA